MGLLHNNVNYNGGVSFVGIGCVHGKRAWSHRSMTPKSLMMTPPNGNIFRVTGHLCGEFTGNR